MGKSKKKKKHKQRHEEGESLLSKIDMDIMTQYRDIREDIEDYQYQIYLADKKTRKKYQKALKKGKAFDFYNSDTVKKRKKIIEEMENEGFLDRVLRLCKDLIPIVRLLGRLVSTFLLALLSFDVVKKGVNPDTLKKMDQIFVMGMSV